VRGVGPQQRLGGQVAHGDGTHLVPGVDGQPGGEQVEEASGPRVR
jgi:hypothetical protein